ncbi:MAG TPA: amidinotransferase [Microscillaceae bacterium]|jgi:arginine deiminase|nr:amidinotransferase [Microscillaceae bacterium]
MQQNEPIVHVSSEVGQLKRVMIHSPDAGLGKVVPSKAQDWLFEDIIHLEMMRSNEYDFFIKILLYFLDETKIKGKIAEIDDPANKRNFYKPHEPTYFQSDKVVEPQFLLSEILANDDVKLRLVSAIAAVERCSFAKQDALMRLDNKQLAKTLISGAMPTREMIFPPVPNFIFTRDIGIAINDHILLNRPAKVVRLRESLMMKYIFHYHPIFAAYTDKILEMQEDDHHFFMHDDDKDLHQVTLEGGDVMMVSPNHLLIGHSERTSYRAINQAIRTLFEKDIVQKVTVVQIPKRRDFMHIDTIFTQVKRDVWVVFGLLSKHNQIQHQHYYPDDNLIWREKGIKKPKLVQFQKGRESQPLSFDFLEDLLDDISQNDLQAKSPTRFIYSGDGEFPFELREQWTDSCNVLALKDGVVIGYDRNTKTAEAFKKQGFQVVEAETLLDQFEANQLQPAQVENTLILLPSGELSRARGGSHCMSMPLLRGTI